MDCSHTDNRKKFTKFGGNGKSTVLNQDYTT